MNLKEKIADIITHRPEYSDQQKVDDIIALVREEWHDQNIMCKDCEQKELQAHKEATLDGDCQVCDYETFQRLIKEKDKRIADLQLAHNYNIDKIAELEFQLKDAKVVLECRSRATKFGK